MAKLKDFKTLKDQWLKDTEVRKEYDALSCLPNILSSEATFIPFLLKESTWDHPPRLRSSPPPTNSGFLPCNAPFLKEMTGSLMSQVKINNITGQKFPYSWK